MLDQLAPLTKPLPLPVQGRRVECRVYQRLPSKIPGFCQPAAAHGSEETRWAATVRDVSQGGLLLQLRRRYEPGTGLAIELPVKGDQETRTFLVRVTHVRALPAGFWNLGCQFISPLGEEELQCILANGGKRTIDGVQLQLVTAQDKVVACLIQRLTVPSYWPLIVGKTLVIRRNSSGHPPWSVKGQVVQCSQEGENWSLRCRLLHPSSASDVLNAMGGKANGTTL